MARVPSDNSLNTVSAEHQRVYQGPRVGVGVIIRGKDESILLGKRKNSHGAGKWSLPGGHVEHFERIHQAAIREVQEETGLVVHRLDHGPFYPYVENLFYEEGLHYVTFFVTMECLPGEPKNMEPEKNEGWQWHPWYQLPDPSWEGLQRVLKLVDPFMIRIK